MQFKQQHWRDACQCVHEKHEGYAGLGGWTCSAYSTAPICSVSMVHARHKRQRGRGLPIPELLHFFFCDVSEQHLRLVDGMPWRQDGGQVIALSYEVVTQMQCSV